MRIQNGLSVDVEDYFHAEAITGHIGREKWDSMESRVVRNTMRTLDLLSRSSVKGTFFILGWVASRFPQLVRDIQTCGHELACHSYWHRLIYRLSPEEFREDTRQAKQTVEDAAGVEVIGYRAPTFSITQRTPWALEILSELGFRYDSSIFPVRHDNYGMPEHSRFPCHHGETNKWDIIECPMATWRFLGTNLPFGGGGYLRIFPFGYTRHAFKKVNGQERMPVIVYFHPWEIDPGQPRVNVKLKSRLRHYTNLSKMETRITRLLQEFEFVPLCELLKQDWPNRKMEALHDDGR